jgi:nucleoside-diphosphate-sugar epimerase
MTDLAIIGAGGFVGTRLVESLVLDGRPGIRPIVRSYRNLAGLCRFGSTIDVRLADAEAVDSLAEALAGVRTAVNLTNGAPAGILRSTRTIFEACRRAGVPRLVHLSSAVVFGDVERPTGDDAAPVDKHWMPYARAKATSEVWLRSRLRESGPEVILLRPGIVWGVRSLHTLDIVKALAARRAYLVDDGRGIFNGIYVDNLVACIRAAADARGQAPGFYNVGDRERVTWREFYDAFAGALECDTARLPRVSGEKFPHSVRSSVDTIQSLPLVNELYHRMKTHIPDGLKASLKSRLEGGYEYGRVGGRYVEQPSVDRELWHLQRVAHKLPIDKFATTFRFSQPVSFHEGVQRTLAWLDTIGVGAAAVHAS